jgi:pterin-4a-carbinolamine dehydratase
MEGNMAGVFISYRRQDSGPTARRLADVLGHAFGPDKIFIDTDSIRSAQNWPAKINEALTASSILMPIIGPRWLYAQDEDGRRRIDLPDDWVRNEILGALKERKTLFPILVSGAVLPTLKAFPECLRPLLEVQVYELKDEYWDRDTNELVKRVANLGLPTAVAQDIVYPAPIDRSKELTNSEQEEALTRIPDWRIVSRRGVHKGVDSSIELYRAFTFKSFEDAIHFMATASRYIGTTNHHPDWQNLWVSVRVWLTTWDIGHRVTFKDVRLAEYLEKLYRDYNVP